MRPVAGQKVEVSASVLPVRTGRGRGPLPERDGSCRRHDAIVARENVQQRRREARKVVAAAAEHRAAVRGERVVSIEGSVEPAKRFTRERGRETAGLLEPRDTGSTGRGFQPVQQGKEPAPAPAHRRCRRDQGRDEQSRYVAEDIDEPFPVACTEPVSEGIVPRRELDRGREGDQRTGLAGVPDAVEQGEHPAVEMAREGRAPAVRCRTNRTTGSRGRPARAGLRPCAAGRFHRCGPSRAARIRRHAPRGCVPPIAGRRDRRSGRRS